MAAGRPIKKRTAKTYQRDIEALGRLRTAIRLDRKLDLTKSSRAVKDLDKLVDSLLDLIGELKSDSAA